MPTYPPFKAGEKAQGKETGERGTYRKYPDGRVVEIGGSKVFCFTTLVLVDGQRAGDVGLFMTNKGRRPYRVIRVAGLGVDESAKETP